MSDAKAIIDTLGAWLPEQDQVKWRAGATTKTKDKAMALAYMDARTYEDVLDEIAGPEWSCEFIPWGDNKVICRLTIAGVVRSSTGEYDGGESNVAEGPKAEAQAFKRACSKFGLGRFLYALPSPWVKYDGRGLAETPRLPANFTRGGGRSRPQRTREDQGGPQRSSAASSSTTRHEAAPSTSGHTEADVEYSGEDTPIGKERGERYRKHLEAQGLDPQSALSLAKLTLGRVITDFGELTEEEAKTLTVEAKSLT